MKQVEKKKRRLEKALATAAAIRIELEKKKQKRKEEEQRLDEEGAALAEAVALQVLVGEDVDVLDGSNATTEDEEGFEGKGESVSDKVDQPAKPWNPLQSVELKQQMCYTYVQATESQVGAEGKVFCAAGHFSEGKLGEFEDVQVVKVVVSDQEVLSNPEDSLKSTNERAKAAEVAAGVAAAQAVAALRIAEEARAEAEAAKKAAEAAISQVLDRKQVSNVDELRLQVNFEPKNVEMERDELKARLEETERQLKEKTRQVVHLEQNLEDMTRYLLQLKAKLPLVVGCAEREGETSERDSSTNLTESSSGTVDQ